jgi:hypothetical protein
LFPKMCHTENSEKIRSKLRTFGRAAAKMRGVLKPGEISSLGADAMTHFSREQPGLERLLSQVWGSF